jgi:3-oxoadipate enol-lactonase
MPRIKANGIEIHYELQGDGRDTLVLLNGVGDDLEAWGYLADAALSAGYRVLRLDNRGVGGSSQPPGPSTSLMMAADTKAVVDGLAIRDLHLVGVSMGGVIAQEYAISYGSDLRSLVLANTYGAAGPYCSRLFRSWAEIAVGAGMPALVRQVSPWIYSWGFFEHAEPTLQSFEAASLATTQSPAAFASQVSALVSHDATDRLGRINVPTLVLAAESDLVIPVELSRRLREAIPGAEWATIPGGHGAMWETAAAFNTAVLSFIALHDGRTMERVKP